MYWLTLAFRRYFDFRGRSRRKEFWMFVVATLLLVIVAGFVDGLLGYGSVQTAAGPGAYGVSARSEGPVSGLLMLALVIPSLTVAIRRLHDADHRGWWVLIGIVPLIGWIILLVFYCTEGTRASNRFGSDPKEEDVAEVFR